MSTPDPTSNLPPDDASRWQPLITAANVVYALQAIGLVVPIAFIAAVMVNYIKREDTAGTVIESHFRWQIRTFWVGLAWMVLGGMTVIILIGIPILFAGYLWLMYRIIKGWLFLIERKPMPA